MRTSAETGGTQQRLSPARLRLLCRHPGEGPGGTFLGAKSALNRAAAEIAASQPSGTFPWNASAAERSRAAWAARALQRAGTLIAAAGIVLLAVGCHHQKQQAYQPPPPQVSSPRNTHGELAQAPPGTFDDIHGKPVLVQTGLASWYGPNYHNHAAADGSIYDQNGMTAAHNTLPLGTTVRVTNLANGEQVLVRITDRGPFVTGRIVDLSLGAAKEIGLYRMGVAKVKLEAFAHFTTDPAGRWCVQTGAFRAEGDALDLKSALLQRYRGAKVTEFAGPTGYWVRIDPAEHDKAAAESVLNWIGDPDPHAKPFLVRVD